MLIEDRMADTRKMTKAQKFVADMIKHRGLEFVQLDMQVEVDGDIGTIIGMNDSANCSGQLIPDTTLSFSSARAGASPPLN